MSNFPENPVHLLLIDPHQMFREAIVSLLGAELDLAEIHEAASAEEALGSPDPDWASIVLLGVNGPNEHPAEFVDCAQNRGLRGRVIVMDGGLSGVDILQLEQKGVAIVRKQESPQVLFSIIRSIVRLPPGSPLPR